LQDFRQGSSGDGGALLSAGAIAGIAVGVVLGLLLLAGLLLLVVRQRQRRRTAAAAATATLASKQDTNTNDVGRTTGGCHSCASHSTASISATGSAQQAQRGQWEQGKGQLAINTSMLSQDNRSSMCSSESGTVLEDKRWVKLTGAISDKVLDIHKQRLKSALLDAKERRSSSCSDPLGITKPGAAASSSGRVAGSPGNSGSLQGTVAQQHSSQCLQQHSSQCQSNLATGAAEADQAAQHNSLKLKEVIGQGTFGTVYR
jgi:hypothetical protein